MKFLVIAYHYFDSEPMVEELVEEDMVEAAVDQLEAQGYWVQVTEE